MGQECFYRENRQDRAEEEILLTERLAEGCGETHWRIRPMTQRENEEIWKRCGEDEGRYQEGCGTAEQLRRDWGGAAVGKTAAGGGI